MPLKKLAWKAMLGGASVEHDNVIFRFFTTTSSENDVAWDALATGARRKFRRFNVSGCTEGNTVGGGSALREGRSGGGRWVR